MLLSFAIFAYLPFCLWFPCFLRPLSLLCLFPLTGSSALVLRAFPRLLVSCLWVSDALPPWSLLLVLFMLWPCVVLVHLLRNSVESQFLCDGVLPLGRVISYGFLGVDLVLSIFAPWSFVLFRFWSMVLFFFCFCSWLGGLSSASVRYVGVPLLLSLHGVFCLPVWAGFLSFRSLLLSFTLKVLSALSSSCLSTYLLSLRCGSRLFYSFFLFIFCVLQLEEGSW